MHFKLHFKLHFFFIFNFFYLLTPYDSGHAVHWQTSFVIFVKYPYTGSIVIHCTVFRWWTELWGRTWDRILSQSILRTQQDMMLLCVQSSYYSLCTGLRSTQWLHKSTDKKSWWMQKCSGYTLHTWLGFGLLLVFHHTLDYKSITPTRFWSFLKALRCFGWFPGCCYAVLSGL